MKNRRGFVTNSSSSSFVVWGKFPGGYDNKKEALLDSDENCHDIILEQGDHIETVMIEYGAEESFIEAMGMLGLNCKYLDYY